MTKGDKAPQRRRSAAAAVMAICAEAAARNSLRAAWLPRIWRSNSGCGWVSTDPGLRRRCLRAPSGRSRDPSGTSATPDRCIAVRLAGAANRSRLHLVQRLLHRNRRNFDESCEWPIHVEDQIQGDRHRKRAGENCCDDRRFQRREDGVADEQYAEPEDDDHQEKSRRLPAFLDRKQAARSFQFPCQLQGA
jgi:hypothetical protein